jgi:hypothetical protein
MTVPLAQTYERRLATPEWQALRDRVHANLEGPSLATAVYGSQARGTARIDSDFDVLQVVRTRPRSYSTGNVNVSAYHPASLRTMARRGSLFILHLKLDAVTVDDPYGLLAEVLLSYVEPPSYIPLMTEIAAAAVALHPVVDTTLYEKSLRRLGIYLVRTAAYATLAARKTPTFDTDRAMKLLGRREVTQAANLRLTSVGKGDLHLILKALRVLLGDIPENRYESVEALAVAYADVRPYASALLTQVLLGESHGIEYTALTPPPL